jgi:hypothetical protein
MRDASLRTDVEQREFSLPRLGKVAERLASHFVSAEIKQFPATQFEAAKQWVINRA